MARQKNDGKGRMGGRAKGTPNKVTRPLKEWINNLLDDNREQIESDMKALLPKDRLIMFEKLLQYVVPKQKTEVEVTNVLTTESQNESWDDWACVPEDLLFEVADCIQNARYQKIIKEKELGK